MSYQQNFVKIEIIQMQNQTDINITVSYLRYSSYWKIANSLQVYTVDMRRQQKHPELNDNIKTGKEDNSKPKDHPSWLVAGSGMERLKTLFPL